MVLFCTVQLKGFIFLSFKTKEQKLDLTLFLYNP